MKGKYLRRLGGFILAVLLLPGVVTLLSSSTAQAQRRVIIVNRPYYRVYRPFGWGFGPWGYNPYFDYYSRYGHYVFDSSDRAYDQGYQDGMKTGRNDDKDHKTYNAQRSHYFQEAGYGNFGEVYRSGFLRGYADGYRA